MPVAAVADFRAGSSHKVWKLRDRQPRQRQVWNQSLQQQKHPSQVEKGVGDFVSEYRNLTPATRTPKRRSKEELCQPLQRQYETTVELRIGIQKVFDSESLYCRIHLIS